MYSVLSGRPLAMPSGLPDITSHIYGKALLGMLLRVPEFSVLLSSAREALYVT